MPNKLVIEATNPKQSTTGKRESKKLPAHQVTLENATWDGLTDKQKIEALRRIADSLLIVVGPS